MAKIRCVMFDFWNVTAIFNTPLFHYFLLNNSASGKDPEKPFSRLSHEIYKRFDLGEFEYREFFYLLGQASDFKPSVTIDEFSKMFMDILKIDEDMIKIRDMLRRRGIATALITNMNQFHADYIRRTHPRIFSGYDCNFISCEERIAKPDPEAYIRTLDRLGFKAEETIFVDDCLENIEVACDLGIKGWYYNIADEDYYQNGRLEEERRRLKNFLNFLWNRGILKPR